MTNWNTDLQEAKEHSEIFVIDEDFGVCVAKLNNNWLLKNTDCVANFKSWLPINTIDKLQKTNDHVRDWYGSRMEKLKGYFKGTEHYEFVCNILANGKIDLSDSPIRSPLTHSQVDLILNNGWRTDIENAPKDKKVLMFNKNINYLALCHYEYDHWYICQSDDLFSNQHSNDVIVYWLEPMLPEEN